MPIGTAIDINPLYNPYVTNSTIKPSASKMYANRNSNNQYKISKDDDVYKIFIKHGWTWGGDWSSKKDYQHFEKKVVS